MRRRHIFTDAWNIKPSIIFGVNSLSSLLLFLSLHALGSRVFFKNLTSKSSEITSKIRQYQSLDLQRPHLFLQA
jgi:hypothetical protein